VQVEPGEAPQPTAVTRYEELYGLFRETYEALARIYDQIAAL
jgi:hypothetical protein